MHTSRERAVLNVMGQHTVDQDTAAGCCAGRLQCFVDAWGKQANGKPPASRGAPHRTRVEIRSGWDSASVGHLAYLV